jgi:hypothetical protein
VVELEVHIKRGATGPTTGTLDWVWGTQRNPRAETLRMQDLSWPMLMKTRGEGLWFIHDLLRANELATRIARPRDPA